MTFEYIHSLHSKVKLMQSCIQMIEYNEDVKIDVEFYIFLQIIEVEYLPIRNIFRLF